MPKLPQLVLVFLFLGGCDRQGTTHTERKPLLNVENSTIDLGVIRSETDIVSKARFVYSNFGTEMLVVESVESGCGCTVAQVSKKRLSPGESGILEAVISEVGNGVRSVTVKLNTNDPIQPSALLRVIWTGVSTFAFDAAEVRFGVVEGRKGISQKVKLNCRDERICSDCKLVNIISHNSSIRVRLPDTGTLPVKVSDGLDFTVELSPGVEPGNFETFVEFKFQGCPRETQRVAVQWQVPSSIEVVPRAIVLSNKREGDMQAILSISVPSRLGVKSLKKSIRWSISPDKLRANGQVVVVDDAHVQLHLNIPAVEDEFLNGFVHLGLDGYEQSVRVPVALWRKPQ